MDTKKLKQELIDKIFKPIKKAGGDVFFVGGCVRDSLMGSEPHDFDITTNFTPEKLHTVFTRFSNVSKNAEQFGVTMVLVEICGKMEEVEIATFRKDTSTGRHPTVSLDATIEEDASRRDFTVNALYEDKDGNITDPTGLGIQDIKAKRLRFIGRAVDRVDEDNLRLFRFCRFMAQKGFKPSEVDTQIDVDLPKFVADTGEHLFADVSKERQLKEIKGIFGGKFFMTKGDRTLYFMKRFGILDEIGLTPMLDEMKQTTQSFRWHAEGSKHRITGSDIIYNDDTLISHIKDGLLNDIVSNGTVYDHTLNVVKSMQQQILNEFDLIDSNTRALLMISAFLHDVGKSKSELGIEINTFEICGKTFTETVPKVSDHDLVGAPIAYDFCKKLCMSNDDCGFVKDLVLNHMRMHQLGSIKSNKKARDFLCKRNFKYLVMLAKADESGCIKTVPDEWDGIETVLNTDRFKLLISLGPNPQPILNGNDLIEKGYTPNPKFKKALDVAHRIQIDQNITDKNTLYSQIKSILKS